jgi:putative transposase
VYLDGIVLRRSWAGEVRNVSLLMAIGVNREDYREILGICAGAIVARDPSGLKAADLTPPPCPRPDARGLV